MTIRTHHTAAPAAGCQTGTRTACPVVPRPRTAPGPAGAVRARTAARVAPVPRLTTTVPREYVHRASHAEVFLTGSRRLAEHQFALTAEWPHRHPFFTSPDGRHHHPLQAAETIRQTGLLLAHTQYGIPLDHHFLLTQLHLAVHPRQLATAPGPTELAVTATTTDTTHRGKRLTHFTMDIVIHRNGHPCATGGGHFATIPGAVYRRLRGTTAPPPRTRTSPGRTLSPAATRKNSAADVVLAETGRPRDYLLDPDPAHPTLFEHISDHYPGMVLLEAAFQAAVHTRPGRPVPTGLHAHFHQYAEYTAPVRITADTGDGAGSGDGITHITARQEGRTPFTATLTHT
ncbi:ScbA/BarX family gamma-butyrolactone biosynthesis protein [Streptomyces tsukubensis]|uniref:ScbA/BarX family gamma-butyrolactone biosynthesis protein n=1 Tax=Streptomyces tsukubensis TaxID=83656 RepID=UPI003695AD6F